MSRTAVFTWASPSYGAFVDIDGLACVMAYSELLSLEGKSAFPLLPAPLNFSVTERIRKTVDDLGGYFRGGDFDEAVVMDVSDYHVFSDIVPVETVVEIYDHHFGFEDYWKGRIGDRSKIESVWAAATLVWEEFGKRGKRAGVSEGSASLLAHAILSNTVNFTSDLVSDLVSDRDRSACDELVTAAALPHGWKSQYFEDQKALIESDITEAVRLDTKISSPADGDPVFHFGQMEIWGADRFFDRHDMDAIFKKIGAEHWIFNLVDIESSQSTIASNMPDKLLKVSTALDIPITKGRIRCTEPLLRKQIFPILRSQCPLPTISSLQRG